MRYTMLAAAMFFMTVSFAGEKKLKIVCTSYPVGLIAGQLEESVLEKAEIITVAPNDTGCLHNFELKPEDIEKLNSADIIVYADENYDKAFEKYLQETKIEKYRLVKPLRFCLPHDPHFFSSFYGMQGIVEDWIDFMITKLPDEKDKLLEGKKIFKEYKMEYKSKELEGKKVILLHHSLFNYASDMGFVILGTILDSNGNEQSPEVIAQLIQKAREEKVDAVLADMMLYKGIPMPNPPNPIATNIAKELNVPVISLNSLIHPPFYIMPLMFMPNSHLYTLQRTFGYNLMTIKHALSPEKIIE